MAGSVTEVATSNGSLLVALEQSGALTPTSLLLPEDTSKAELKAIGRMLNTIKQMTSFATGDELVFAKDNYGDEFWVELVEECGWNYHSAENIMSVCRNVRPDVRVEGLSFGHHDVVRKMIPSLQTEWLQEARESGWSRQRLRDEIFGEKVLPPAVPPDLPDVVRDALAGAREMNDGWWISRDSYQRLRAAVEGET